MKLNKSLQLTLDPPLALLPQGCVSRSNAAEHRRYTYLGNYVILVTTLLVTGCALTPSKGAIALQGTWKSNEEMTLASVRSSPNVTEEARAIFESDFFGHLFVEFRGDTVRHWLDDEDYDTGYVKYKLVEETSDYVMTSEWSALLGEYSDEKYHLDGNCYYVITSFDVREYFCRVS